MTNPFNRWVLPVSILAGAFLILPGGLLAQEEDDAEGIEFEPTTEEVLDFLKEKMPESVELLDKVREEESIEVYMEVLGRAVEILIDYHYISGDGNEEMGDLFVEIKRVEIQIEVAIEAWHEAETEKERRAVRADLKSKISQHFDLKLEFSQLELDALKAEVESIELEVAEVESEREQLIEKELEDALGHEDEE